MPHYTDTQIQAANQRDLAAFLISRGERLKRVGSQELWEPWLNISKERLGAFLVTLLLLAKDECRKSLDAIEWAELEARLAAEYTAHTDNGGVKSRLRQLDSDMKALDAVYAKDRLAGDRNVFLKPILRVCMDCVRLVNYLGKVENAPWDK